MLETIVEKLTAERNPLKLSAGIKFARTECTAAREVKERADRALRDLHALNRIHMNERTRNVSDAEIAAAEDDLARADKRYSTARKALADARTKFEPRWLERLGPIGADMKKRVAELADALEAAVQTAREVEAFATCHGLPVTLAIASVPEIASLVARLRNITK